MEYEVLNLFRKEKWNNFLNELPTDQQDIYYIPEYYEVYENRGDGKASCFVFKIKNNIALYPFLLNSVNKLNLIHLNKEYWDIQGAYGYNGVITSTYNPDFIKNFFKSFDHWCTEKNVIAEFTRFHPILANHKFSENNMNVAYDRKTVYLDLDSGYKYIWDNLYSSINRNMIRKAQKNNLQVTIDSKKSDYDEFYNLYIKTMINVNANQYYFFSYPFFENFRNQLGDHQKIIKVQCEDKTICCVIIMIKGNYAHYHLSGIEKSSLPANNLALDAAIKLAIELGCKKFHFGGGKSRSEDDLLLKFKSNFSKNKANFYIGKKIHNEDIYNRVCEAWQRKYPEKKEKLKNIVLKYRET